MSHTRIDVRRILCPVDFSEFSVRALEHAARVASFFDATVHVLHVLPGMVDLVDPLMAPLAHPPEAARDKAMRGLAQLMEPVAEWNVPIESAVRIGNPARQIEAATHELPADLIVMGTHGRTGLPHVLMGSVAETVMHRVSCPVLTIGHRTATVDAPPFRRILCPIDLMPGSEHTLDFALALAAESDAEVEVLHVVETIALDPKAGHAFEGEGAFQAQRRRMIAEAGVHLRQAIPPGLRNWCTVRQRVATGEPWPAIVEAARSGRAEVIVMGAHAKAIDRVLFGSTTQRVVRESPCAVLVVHQPRSSQSETRGRQVMAAAGVAR